MTLTLQLTPETEARLRAAAQRDGLDPAVYAERMLVEYLPALEPGVGAAEHSPTPGPGATTLALFARWEAEDGTDDPEEIAARTREWEELKANLEANTLSLRVPEL